jgi:hypothetical protein
MLHEIEKPDPGGGRASGCLHSWRDLQSDKYPLSAVTSSPFEFAAFDPARMISARYGISLTLAVVVAALAGFHGGQR